MTQRGRTPEIAILGGGIGGLAAAAFLRRAGLIPVRALRRYEARRLPRTTRLQEVSHGRSHLNHLPDGPEQSARDKVFAGSDPLAANAWIYEYDAQGS